MGVKVQRVSIIFSSSIIEGGGDNIKIYGIEVQNLIFLISYALRYFQDCLYWRRGWNVLQFLQNKGFILQYPCFPKVFILVLYRISGWSDIKLSFRCQMSQSINNHEPDSWIWSIQRPRPCCCCCLPTFMFFCFFLNTFTL